VRPYYGTCVRGAARSAMPILVFFFPMYYIAYLAAPKYIHLPTDLIIAWQPTTLHYTPLFLLCVGTH
jgi:hypothetical protein